MLRVLHYVSKMDRAGQETFIMNLFRKIDRDSIQFDFLCTDHVKGDYDEEIYTLGGEIYYMPSVTMRGPLKQVQLLFSLIKVLKEQRCDVFHIHTHHAMGAYRDAVAAKIAGVKIIVVHSHNSSALFHLRAHEYFKKMLCKLKIQRFACSKLAGEWMFSKGNYQVLHNGLDMDVFAFDSHKREQIRKCLGWENKKIIGHIGRFNEQKNQSFLIDVFADIYAKEPQSHLVLVGKGELETEIKNKVEQLGLTEAVSFLGARDDVQILYQGMDLFLFPSLFEGLPVVLVEAQASGLACLISNTISKEAVFSNRTVECNLTDTPQKWADKALELLKSDYDRSEGRYAVQKAGYDITELATQLEKIYTS